MTPASTSAKKPPAPPAQADVLFKENPWRPMDTAPMDGTYVYLKGDPCEGKDVENHWYWYQTRLYKNHRWEPIGWWRRRFGTKAPPSFVPGGWRSIAEGPAS